uniref:Type I polyketide synthase n=1 Tax=Gambierdiscus polynesiensis TaxID=439318 RepID=A0A1S6K870_9DINO|nr:type I polyketide synthase [Gambierdiscus polynesiensis]
MGMEQNTLRPEDGGFDIAWPATPEEHALDFGLQVAELLASKGFCVVQGFSGAVESAAAEAEAADRTDWQRFAAEIEPGYLGRSASGKVAWLESDEARESQLGTFDQQLTELSAMLEPMTLGSFGFAAVGRTDGLLRKTFSGRADEDAIMSAQEKLDDMQVQVFGKVEDHLKFVQQRKICMMYFVSGNGGNLYFHRKLGPGASVPCVEGHIVVFRHDLLSYTYDPEEESLALQAWILADGQATVMQEYTGPPQNFDQAMGLVSGPTAPIYGKTGKSVSIMSMDAMLAGNGIGAHFFWNFLVAGCDAIRHLSQTRWDATWYYEPNKDLALGKYYSNHGGFVLEEHLMGFDADFFGIDPEEVEMIDPIQRNSMEVGYNTLYKAGWDRDSLKNAHVGVFVGNCGTDWTSVKLSPAVCPVNEKYIHLFSAHSLNTRISYTFGLRGPLSTSDTACSSSLVATGTAHNAMRRLEPEQAAVGNNAFINWCLIIGTNALLGPFSWIGLCGPHMLSPTGRCFTFDGHADGFSRGEGTTAVSAKVTDKEPSGRLAVFCGTCINQDGRSASMTAPHGPSQQECLWGSLREANVIPSDIRIAELHGTGTALGDPIEVGALRGVMKVRDGPICKTSAKSNIAHAEANAGTAGLVKCFMMLMHGCVPPNVHLVALNPHIDANGYPVQFGDSLIDLGTNSGYAGVSSFGFGGTNARADLWARVSVGPREANTMDWNKLDYIIVRCPRCMGWMEHVCGAMMPSRPTKPVAGRYKANMIRDEFDNYDYCSLCYKGPYQYGVPPDESSIPSGRMFIAGTWDAWSSKQEVQQDPNGVWHHFQRLGETRMEQFRFMLEQNDNFAFYPAIPRAGIGIRTEGPCAWKEGHNWLIDARDDEWPEGQLIHIMMTPDSKNGAREVTWEAVEEDGGPSEFPSFRHSYQVMASWTSFQMADMAPVRGERGTYELQTRLGPGGQESFQIARDNDVEQVFYPAYSSRRGVPVRGPDHLGNRNFFVIQGEHGERVVIRIKVQNGHTTVKATSASTGSRTWESVDGKYHRCLSLAGTFTDGRCQKMEEDTLHVYRAQITMGDSGVEEFQVLQDDDPERAFYPESGGFASGQVLVCGPDGNSEGRSFRIEGIPSVQFEISFDAKALDRRRIITWKPILEDGILAVPWTNSSPLK